MSWPCRYFSSRDAVVEAFGFVPVGAIWPAHDSREVSPNYERDWKGKRPPLVVQLPSGAFDIDGRAWKDGASYGDGWKVTGSPPLITLAPSINIVGYYHGYIRNGVITDDCEGRTFQDARGFPQ